LRAPLTGVDVPPSSKQNTLAVESVNHPLRVRKAAKNDEEHDISDDNVKQRSSPDSTLSYEYVLGVAQIHLPSGTSPCPGLLTSPDRLFMLNRLYLHLSTHGSGLASLLVKKAEEDIKALEGKGIWLGCWEDNKRGRRFYEKMGYEEKGRVEFMLGKSRRIDWVMEKVL
jgi:ribosomal protein S18 acetylase RimI-like enzyme